MHRLKRWLCLFVPATVRGRRSRRDRLYVVSGLSGPLAVVSSLLVLAILPVGHTTGHASEGPDAAAKYAALSGEASADGQAWYQLACEARLAGDYAVALRALAQAQTLEFSPARIAIERARVAVLTGEPDSAEGELQKLLDSGFTAVHVITSDPELNSLSGRQRYDAIIAAMSVSAYPCQHRDEFRGFDFWLGDWVVHLADGQLAGYNSITAVEKGCLILEQWTSASGGSGRSINYLDKASGEWVQIWIDSNGNQIDFRGGLTDEGMLLVGQVHSISDGSTQPYRGLWTPLPDGRVRQFFEQSGDGGKTWTPTFEGFYKRGEQAEGG